MGQRGLAWVSAMAWGCSPGLLHPPETPCPSRHEVRLLRSGTPALCACSISASLLLLELSYPRLTHPAPGALPANISIKCWEATGPLAPGAPPATQREAPPPLVPEPEEGTSSARCHHALEPGRRLRADRRTHCEGCWMQRAGLLGPLRLLHRGQSCQRDAEVSSRSTWSGRACSGL